MPRRPKNHCVLSACKPSGLDNIYFIGSRIYSLGLPPRWLCCHSTIPFPGERCFSLFLNVVMLLISAVVVQLLMSYSGCAIQDYSSEFVFPATNAAVMQERDERNDQFRKLTRHWQYKRTRRPAIVMFIVRFGLCLTFSVRMGLVNDSFPSFSLMFFVARERSSYLLSTSTTHIHPASKSS